MILIYSKHASLLLKSLNIQKKMVTLISGSYEYERDGSQMASWIYLYRLEAGNYIDMKKALLLW
jgi:hypothetical protein